MRPSPYILEGANAMIEIPGWIQTFVIAGIGLLAVVIPVRVIWGLTRGARERARKLADLAGRLKGRFENVRIEGRLMGPQRILLRHEGRPAAIARPRDGEVAIRVEPGAAPAAHAILRSRGRTCWPFAWMGESLRFLPRVRLADPLIDESIAIYARGAFGAYLRDLALGGAAGEEKPEGLAESLVVLRRMPGTERFEVRLSPSGGFRLRFRLRADDLLYRPEDVESAVHHAFRLYDLLAMA